MIHTSCPTAASWPRKHEPESRAIDPLQKSQRKHRVVDRTDLPDVELRARNRNLIGAFNGRDSVPRIEEELRQPVLTIAHHPRIDFEDVPEDEPLVKSRRLHQKEVRLECSALHHLWRPEKRTAAAFYAGQQIFLNVLLFGNDTRQLRDQILNV